MPMEEPDSARNEVQTPGEVCAPDSCLPAPLPPSPAPTPLEYARIHASVLAMLLAAQWAYSLVSYRRVDELRAAVVEAAEQINDLAPVGSAGAEPDELGIGE